MSGAPHKIMKITIDKIVIPEVRARSQFTEEQIQFLKASLGKYGLLSYPIVRPLADGNFELIDGEHRVRTAREQGIEEIECLVLEADDKDAVSGATLYFAGLLYGPFDFVSNAVAVKIVD